MEQVFFYYSFELFQIIIITNMLLKKFPEFGSNLFAPNTIDVFRKIIYNQFFKNLNFIITITTKNTFWPNK